MKNWYCKPASEAEAIEIVERAVANGVVAKSIPSGFDFSCDEFSWDYCGFWGAYGGKTITHGCTVLHEAGEQLTIQQVREQFPFPSEVKVMSDEKEWQGQQDGLPTYTHEFSDVGVHKKCTIVTDKTDSDGFILVEDAFGKYHLVQKHDLMVIRTERDKWIEQAVIHATKEGYINEELAFFIARKIYDNMIKNGGT